ncbi:NADH-quinone oxidoreductase subunit K [Methylocystis sp. ATCC 49242]|uniref:NADH-quinone oxidoreductase subunit K n=1 Tax=Methylocystis sp. ATCC 49242 TaxID=622637 RepID=UPI0001F8861E|nr:NADH-quinone oxidoreductase subunit K [Methylocystis sp. ATCC 49242]
MNAITLAGLGGAALVGLGLYGLVTNPHLLRKIVAFNVMGGGVFLLFGAIARRGAAAGVGADPVPQALVITGIVVAFSATALAVALLLRVFKVMQTPFFPTDPADRNGAS